MLLCRTPKYQWEVGLFVTLWILLVNVQAFQGAGSSRAVRPVSVYATVEDKGKLIGGLTPQNFRLSEEGQPRPFKLAEPENPASVALLVEYSQSSWLYFGDIQYALQGFMNALPEGNWYALATFSHGMNVEVDFTKQKGRLGQAFSQLGQPMWNEVDTYDAVYEMLEKMERLPGRRVVILIGSGFDSFSHRTLDDVTKKIESTNVLVYGAATGSMLRGSYEPYLGSMRRMDLLTAEVFLKMLADKSGGEVWFPNFENAFVDVMQGIAQDLQYQYRLVYTPQVPADGKFHKIKVEAFQVIDDKRHDYKVRVREGWRFE